MVPIVGTITPDTTYGWSDWKNIYLTNAWIEYYVSTMPSMCLSDQFSGIAPYWDYGYTYDKKHPNWWGYWIMGRNWYYSILECDSK